MPKARQNGFTLIEVAIAVVLLSIIASAMFNVMSLLVVSYKKQEKMAEAQDNMRIVIGWVTRDVKAAQEIIFLGDGSGKGEENSLKVRLADGTAYKYYYAEGIFYRKEDHPGAQPQPLTNTGYILNNPPYPNFSPSYSFFTPCGEMIKITMYGGYENKPGEYVVTSMVTEVHPREFILGEWG